MTETAVIGLESLSCNPRGLTALGSFASAVERNRGKNIIVDCKLVNWIDANIAAALGALDAMARASGSTVTFQQLRFNVGSILQRNGLFAGATSRPHSTCIPLKQYALHDGRRFAENTSAGFANQDMPIMSTGLRQKFFEGLDELFNNASIHSKSVHGIYGVPPKNRSSLIERVRLI